MDINEFIEKFAEALEIEDISELTGDTYFRELDDWSSLGGLSVISMFDEDFNKELSIADFKKAETLEDLFKLAVE